VLISRVIHIESPPLLTRWLNSAMATNGVAFACLSTTYAQLRRPMEIRKFEQWKPGDCPNSVGLPTSILNRYHSLRNSLKLEIMNRFITNRNLIIVNFAIVSYFILIWLIRYYRVDFILIGVFIELLTIPFLIAQIIFLVIGINFILKSLRNFLTIISVLALAVCTIITIGSFF
jgi:hypothetical protein